ncbi:Probable aspartoacylase [Durusdinium trenchii]|uniref:Probable aspartoacylase n=1 Tax=Durusdinium trenchii TaxID=1381693 RepID=A0ABP0RRN2_9DINO
MNWKRRRTLPSSSVKTVAIVGGTHGNETNGVHLAKHFMRNPALVKRPSFETEVLLSNVAAIQQNTRYVEEDLNRCYLLEDLQNDAKSTSTLERKRAREVDAQLGPKSSSEPKCDFIIDLHNTTAATGVALLMAPNDEFAHEVAHHLMSLDETVRVVEWNDQADWPLCPSIGRSGLTFEVGPCPWGCLEPELFQQSRRLVMALLDYVEKHNSLVASGSPTRQEVSMKVFRSIGVSIDYPRAGEDPVGHAPGASTGRAACFCRREGGGVRVTQIFLPCQFAILENVLGLLKVIDEVKEALTECGDYEMTLQELDPTHGYALAVSGDS